MAPDGLRWLFFGLSGRIDRQVYALAAILSYLLRFFPFYHFTRLPQGAPGADFWAMMFMLAGIVSLWINVALSVKRLHDADKPGAFAAITIILDVFAVIGFGFLRGTPGPNRFGDLPNAPQLPSAGR